MNADTLATETRLMIDSPKAIKPSGPLQVGADLAERIQGYIERKACGRIRDLQVVCLDDLIILQGRSRTYHAKQLAQEAVLDLTRGKPLLANQIVVC